jgi:hypothetical protein
MAAALRRTPETRKVWLFQILAHEAAVDSAENSPRWVADAGGEAAGEPAFWTHTVIEDVRLLGEMAEFAGDYLGCWTGCGGSKRRAWRVTGDYGSGKSSFALVLAQLLRAPLNPELRQVRSLVPLPRELGHGTQMLPVLITGSRGGIVQAASQGITQAISRLQHPQGPALIADAEEIASRNDAVGLVHLLGGLPTSALCDPARDGAPNYASEKKIARDRGSVRRSADASRMDAPVRSYLLWMRIPANPSSRSEGSRPRGPEHSVHPLRPEASSRSVATLGGRIPPIRRGSVT